LQSSAYDCIIETGVYRITGRDTQKPINLYTPAKPTSTTDDFTVIYFTVRLFGSQLFPLRNIELKLLKFFNDTITDAYQNIIFQSARCVSFKQDFFEGI
jgi:hypothetical protein